MAQRRRPTERLTGWVLLVEAGGLYCMYISKRATLHQLLSSTIGFVVYWKSASCTLPYMSVPLTSPTERHQKFLIRLRFSLGENLFGGQDVYGNRLLAHDMLAIAISSGHFRLPQPPM